MLSNVFLKSLRDQRGSLLWWGMGVALLVASLVAIFPSIQGIEAFEEVAEAYPKELMALFGVSDITEMTSATGFLNAELFGLMGPLIVMIFAILIGSGAIAGEEGSGTIELMLSEPITRGRFVAEKFASMVVAICALIVTFTAVLLIGATMANMDIALMRLVGMTFSLALLGLTFGSLAFALGCIAGRRNVAAAVAAAAGIATYLANVLREIVDFMDPARWVSPFYYYNDNDILSHGVDVGHVAVLAAAVVVMATVSRVAFGRRDLRL